VIDLVGALESRRRQPSHRQPTPSGSGAAGMGPVRSSAEAGLRTPQAPHTPGLQIAVSNWGGVTAAATAG